MASDKHAPGFVPGQGFSQEDWDEVCDNPEITDEQWAAAQPLAEVMPDLVEAVTRRRGAQKAPTKEMISLRLDRAVLEAWRASGPGWQARMGDALRKAAGL